MPLQAVRHKRMRLLLFLVAGVSCAYAQLTGSFEGTVTDPSARIAPGAEIQVKETLTGAQRKSAADNAGRYLMADLEPGVYRLEVSSPGFPPVVREGLVLTAGKSIRVDIALQLAETRESVTVVSEADQVDTSAGAWGASLNARQLNSLPVAGRDLFGLVAQTPGATVLPNASIGLTTGFGLHVSINGARPSDSSFRLDGVYINDTSGAAPASAGGGLLGMETVGELHMVTSPFSAEYGRSAGGVITAVSKSGSNEFHGKLYEYFRNNALDAKNFFDSVRSPIPPLRRNQFGVVASGPIIKNKLFFLANREGIRIASSATQNVPTLTAEARQGLLPVNGVVTHVIVSPVAAPYIALYPLPNGPSFGDGTAQYISAVSSTTRENYGTGKADYLQSARLRFSGRYTRDKANQDNGDPLGVFTY